MNRVGKLPGNGRYIILISQDEYLQMKAKGFKITDSVPLQHQLFGFNKSSAQGNRLEKQPHHDRSLWKTASRFFDLQLSRNPVTLRFQILAKYEKLIRQGKQLNPTEKTYYRDELARRIAVIDTWYYILLKIEAMGYSEKYIFKVIQYAENDIASKDDLQRNPRWMGWARNFLSITPLLKLSSNKISKWENIVASYERNLKRNLSFFGNLDENGDFEI